MQANQKFRPTLLRTERRAARREALVEDRVAELFLPESEPLPVTLSMLDFGTFGLMTDLELQSRTDLLELRVERQGSILVNGNWRLASRRKEGCHNLLVFEHPLAEVIRDCGRTATPDTFLRTSRYKIYAFSNDEDLAAVSSHLSELKDFGRGTLVTIHCAAGTLSGRFDFSSERKTLDLFEFQLEKAPGPLRPGDKVLAEYTYQCVRYAFSTALESYDQDFNLLSLHAPSYLLAITARGFDRHPCDLPALIKASDVQAEGRLIQLSPKGGQIRVPELATTPIGTALELTVPSVPERLSARLVHRGETASGIRFDDDEVTCRGLHRLYVSTLPSGILCRAPEHYQKFFKLFRLVDYAPEDEKAFLLWQDETVRSWSFQDQLLPGNCTGGVDAIGDVVSSTGTLPFAEQVAYGHSFCMVKTAEGASTFFTQALHSLAVAELIPGVRFYAGSYAKQSRFTTRLHVLFKNHAAPDRQAIVHSEQLFPTSPVAEEATSLKVDEVRDLESIPKNMPLSEVVHLLVTPHRLFNEVHKVTPYLATLPSDGTPCAVILKSEAWRTFTAAGMFGFTWLFPIREDVNLAQLALEARRHPLFAQSPFQVLSYDGSEPQFEYTGTDRKKPAFWTITDKDDFGPIIASMARSISAILRKYGEAGLVEQLKVS